MARKQNPMTRSNLLDAALSVIRTKGYAATTVDDICNKASLSKGAFFHHFSSKEDLAVAAANYWSEMTGTFFAEATYHAPEDPLERVLAYVELRKQLIQGELPAGTAFQAMQTRLFRISQPRWNAIRLQVSSPLKAWLCIRRRSFKALSSSPRQAVIRCVRWKVSTISSGI